MLDIINGTKDRADYDYYATNPKCVLDIVKKERKKESARC